MSWIMGEKVAGRMWYHREHETFRKEPVDFAGKIVSVATTQLCHFRTEKGNK